MESKIELYVYFENEVNGNKVLVDKGVVDDGVVPSAKVLAAAIARTWQEKGEGRTHKAQRAATRQQDTPSDDGVEYE